MIKKIVLCLLISGLFIGKASGVDLLTVDSVVRLTHPAFRAGNIFYGVREKGMWNVDNTRIMLYESNTTYSHPDWPAEKGRGIVWATVADAKTGYTDLADYKSKWTPVPFINEGATLNVNRCNLNGYYWSPLAGEANIIYGMARSGGHGNDVIKINVDTGVVTEVVQIAGGDIVDAIDLSTRCYGYRKDNDHLICSENNEDWANGGWDIDLVAGTYATIASGSEAENCGDSGYGLFPLWESHGHSGASPDGSKVAAKYGFPVTSPKNHVQFTSDCTATGKYEDDEYVNERLPYPWFGVHLSWHASEEWFLSNSTYPSTVTADPTAPSIITYKLFQIFFDSTATPPFTYRELYTITSAHRWNNGVFDVGNDDAHLRATINTDGTYAIFNATDGGYTKEDAQHDDVTDYVFEAFFLVDFGGAPTPVECADGVDNDSDGFVDLADSGCDDANDNDETNPAVPDDTVAYWKLDETSGTSAADSSVNTNTGTLLNSPSWVTGKTNNGLSFDGADDAVDVNSDASIDSLFSSGGTIAAWVYPDSAGEGNQGKIYDKRKMGLYVESTGMGVRFVQEYATTDGVWSTGNGKIPASQWTHIVVTYTVGTSNDPLIYINGVSQTVTEDSTPLGAVQSDASHDGCIGQAADAGGGCLATKTFDGIIDEVRLYDRVLLLSEIVELYNYTAPESQVTDPEKLTGIMAEESSLMILGEEASRLPLKLIGDLD